IKAEDTGDIVGIELTDQDPNSGHITVLRHRDACYVTWSTRYNATRVAETIKAAEQFIEVARHAQQQRHHRPLVDNLYSAVELLAKATLLTLPDRSLLTSKRHRTIAARFHNLGNLGNVDGSYPALLKELGAMREPARYGLGAWHLADEVAGDLMTRAQA